MTECPFIPSTADRLLRPHRTSHLVRSAPIRRTNGAKRHRSTSNQGECLRRNLQLTAFNPHTNAPTPFKKPADSAFSP